jgi:methylmalonyl-CoA mutase C-terminal domain/subunit
VFAGGIIPEPDRAPLSEMGVAQVFTPGASLQEVTGWLERALDARETRAAPASGGR